MNWLFALVVMVARGALGEAAEPVTLAVGETVTDEATGVTLAFAGVERDSRCPRDVTCVVAGEAVITFEAKHDGHAEVLTFRIPPRGRDEQEMDGITISIVELRPETESTRKIEASDYAASVLIAAR